MPNRIEAVLFDLDDTLLASYPARLAALQSTFDAAGIRDPSAERFIQQNAGGQLSGALEALKETSGVSSDLFNAYRKAYWFQPPPRLYPDVPALLERLQSHGIKMGIVTQKEREFQIDGLTAGVKGELRANGVAPYFGVTVGFADVTRHKPDPEGVLLALKSLGVAPEQALFVGDSLADMQAGLSAGCWTAHARWGLSEGHSLGEVRPHFTLGAPDELFALPLLSFLLPPVHRP